MAVTRSSLPGGGIDRLRERADVVLWPDDDVPASGEALRKLARGADAVLAPYAKVDREFLEAVRGSVRIVALPSAGYDAVDVTAALDAGIVITNAPNVLHETTADTTFALMLLARRLLLPAVDDLRGGEWKRSRFDEHLGLDITGATLGLAGYGQIAQAVARRAAGFGMTVLHSLSRTGSTDLSTAVGWDELLERSDIVSLHVPLTAETKGLIGAGELARMKPTATLINTARGPVVDTAALLQALDDGVIHSAGLDVYDVEPIRDPEHPLLRHPRIAVLPHVGSATEATRARMVDLAVDNILAVLEGRPALTPVAEMKQGG
ncbi:2-hydroxyacid dehydrogenase [Arthrobacter tumbae]|uniref:2-hydroxyacid dehydrogenase n=1 Tax=Arthrobacter tumbae TaxID=163874 RepID=UPI00195ED59E|nr:D-glycerate dehydrogenase [Arthrobacter tumbae]MBM7781182.1 glyoxylate reductase [Arthrobacter tumbae]